MKTLCVLPIDHSPLVQAPGLEPGNSGLDTLSSEVTSQSPRKGQVESGVVNGGFSNLPTPASVGMAGVEPAQLRFPKPAAYHQALIPKRRVPVCSLLAFLPVG